MSWVLNTKPPAAINCSSPPLPFAFFPQGYHPVTLEYSACGTVGTIRRSTITIMAWSPLTKKPNKYQETPMLVGFYLGLPNIPMFKTQTGNSKYLFYYCQELEGDKRKIQNLASCKLITMSSELCSRTAEISTGSPHNLYTQALHCTGFTVCFTYWDMSLSMHINKG